MLREIDIGTIAEGFTRIESLDIRVSKLILTRDQYANFRSQEAGRMPHIISFDIEGGPNFNHSLGHIWGASIEIGDRCEVRGEEGFVVSDEGVESRGTYVATALKLCKVFFKGHITIIVKSRANFLKNFPKNEAVALESLREMISEVEFRKYMRYGFINVKSKSGKIYQIFRNHSHTRVWKNGRVIEEVCVRISDKNIPATDNVIAFKTIIETNEDEFKKLGNVYKLGIAA